MQSNNFKLDLRTELEPLIKLANSRFPNKKKSIKLVLWEDGDIQAQILTTRNNIRESIVWRKFTDTYEYLMEDTNGLLLTSNILNK